METIGKAAGTAFWLGYEDGLYGDPAESFTGNLRLASLEEPEERLDYYRGHRAGNRERSVRALRAA